VARDGGARSRIETAENHVQTPSEDIRFISDQTNLLVDSMSFAFFRGL
jgi:hypothetical protein